MHLREPQTLLPRSWFLRACAIPVSYHQLWKPGADLVKTGEELERRPYCTPELLWGLEELWLRKERAQGSGLVLLLPGHAMIVSSRPVGDPMPSQGCEPFPFEHTATADPSAPQPGCAWQSSPGPGSRACGSSGAAAVRVYGKGQPHSTHKAHPCHGGELQICSSLGPQSIPNSSACTSPAPGRQVIKLLSHQGQITELSPGHTQPPRLQAQPVCTGAAPAHEGVNTRPPQGKMKAGEKAEAAAEKGLCRLRQLC